MSYVHHLNFFQNSFNTSDMNGVKYPLFSDPLVRKSELKLANFENTSCQVFGLHQKICLYLSMEYDNKNTAFQEFGSERGLVKVEKYILIFFIV